MQTPYFSSTLSSTCTQQLLPYSFVMKITVKQPENREEFKAYYDLRWRVLREPWHQPKGSEQDELENESFHIMVCDENNNIVGVGRLHFNTGTEAQIRYMAIEPKLTSKGIGRSILEGLEEKARLKKCKTITLEARESALEFYKKQGYSTVKKSHLLFGSIQHYEMNKTIK